MIAPDKEGKIGCETGTTVIFVEVAYSSVFLRYGHAIEIVAITDCLSLSNISRSKACREGEPGSHHQ